VALALPACGTVRAAAAQWPVAADHASPVWVGRLQLTDFRNYRSVETEVDRRPVVLTGPNGAGKTNLLEALSFLAPGRGLRQAKLGEVDRRRPVPEIFGGTGKWGVAAMICGEHGGTEIGTGPDPEVVEHERERRLVKINGVFASGQSALAERVSVIWLTPQMDRLFLDGASARRRFLDRLAYGFDPDHAGRLTRYERALHERSQVLRQGSANWDTIWLAAIEQQIAEVGIAVAAVRHDLVQGLAQAAARGVGPFPQAALALDGTIDAWLEEMPALAAEDAFRDRLATDRVRDSETGRAQCGPHRSDLVVTHLGKNLLAAQCSTGEQKALLISIVLAHVRLQIDGRGCTPILLLDEVAAHLDAARRSALFDAVLSLDVQAWLTGTEAALFAELGRRAQFFCVREATIAAAAADH
jgi:DNA replication and repair protein RecF